MLWVERRRRVEFFNLFAAEMTQNSAARRTDMWSRGLHGEGQTIGIGDTGIDHDNCFFRDPMVPVPIGRVDPRHRKIVAYWPDSDSGDVLGGHGTHVSGSAVGQSISPEEGIDRINGIAWAAKVAFTDMDPLSVSGDSSPLKSLFWELYHRDRSALPAAYGRSQTRSTGRTSAGRTRPVLACTRTRGARRMARTTGAAAAWTALCGFTPTSYR